MTSQPARLRLGADEIAAHVSDRLSIKLTHASRRFKSLFASEDGSTAVLCLSSKDHRNETSELYWFGYYGNQDKALAEATSAYVALGCGGDGLIFLLPYSVFSPWATGMYVTDVNPEDSGLARRHVYVVRRNEGSYELNLPGIDNPVLDEFLIAGASAREYTLEGTQSAEQLATLAYVPADDAIVTETREPFGVDPDVVDRGLRAHRALQNSLAEIAKASGFEPRRPSSTVPSFDVGWWDGDTFVIVEVKSVSTTNEPGQMKLGVGQVLDYAEHYIKTGQKVRPVLAVERQPSAHWEDLCNRYGIRLVWPAVLNRVLEP